MACKLALRKSHVLREPRNVFSFFFNGMWSQGFQNPYSLNVITKWNCRAWDRKLTAISCSVPLWNPTSGISVTLLSNGLAPRLGMKWNLSRWGLQMTVLVQVCVSIRVFAPRNQLLHIRTRKWRLQNQSDLLYLVQMVMEKKPLQVGWAKAKGKKKGWEYQAVRNKNQHREMAQKATYKDFAVRAKVSGTKLNVQNG